MLISTSTFVKYINTSDIYKYINTSDKILNWKRHVNDIALTLHRANAN